MKKSPQQLALKSYQQCKGNFRTLAAIHLKKESDLSSFYYPGVMGIQKKIMDNPFLPIGLVSTQPKSYYPILTAKAALLSEIAGINVIPLLIRYEHFEKLPEIIAQMGINFKAVFFSGFKNTEREVVKNVRGIAMPPTFFLEEMEAAAALAAILNAMKFLKKSQRTLRITLEGDDLLMMDIVKLLKEEGFQSLTLLDERGPMYRRRPNMNKWKNRLASFIRAEKIDNTREQILAKTDLYLSTVAGTIDLTTTEMLPQQCVIVSLKAESIESRGKQIVVSTLPNLPNHITDLHIPAALANSLIQGKMIHQKSVARAIRSLANFYKSPSPQKIIPGLLEKNLVKKLVKSL